MRKRSTYHATFVVERSLDVPSSRVFAAFADPVLKARCFEGPAEWQKGPRDFDFRVGGRERNSGGPKGGPVHRFSGLYPDILPKERII